MQVHKGIPDVVTPITVYVVLMVTAFMVFRLIGAQRIYTAVVSAWIGSGYMNFVVHLQIIFSRLKTAADVSGSLPIQTWISRQTHMVIVC